MAWLNPEQNVTLHWEVYIMMEFMLEVLGEMARIELACTTEDADEIRQLAMDQEWSVRISVPLFSWGNLQRVATGKECDEILEALLQDPDPRVRYAAMCMVVDEI